MSEQPPAPPIQQQAPVAAPKNGMGLTALILGIIGTICGIIPFLFFLSGTLGVLGVIFGLVALGRVRKGHATNKGVTVIGLIASAVAFILGIVGIVIVVSAGAKLVDEIDKSLPKTESSRAVGTPGAAESPESAVTDFVCGAPSTEDGYDKGRAEATMTVTNIAKESRSYSVQVEWVDASGARVADDIQFASGLAPGQKTVLTAESFEDVSSAPTCKLVEVTSY